MEVVVSREVKISVADATQWQIQGLEEGSLYRFLLSGCTRAGCGPSLAQESITMAQTREYQLWEISTRILTKKIKVTVTLAQTHTHMCYVLYQLMLNAFIPLQILDVRMKSQNLLCTCLLKGTPKDVKCCKISIIAPIENSLQRHNMNGVRKHTNMYTRHCGRN